MGQALRRDDDDDGRACGCLSSGRAKDFFASAPPLVPVRGIEPLPGESWRGYNERIAQVIEGLRSRR